MAELCKDQRFNIKMTEQDFTEYLDEYILELRRFWKDKKKRVKALKSLRDLIDNYLED